MEEAVKKYGNSYATIAKEYFGDCKPTVTRTDVSNFINSNPHLKQFCQTGTFHDYYNLIYNSTFSI